MVVIESKYPKGADFKLWKIGPKLEYHAKFSAQKLIRQRSFASKAENYSEHFEPVAGAILAVWPSSSGLRSDLTVRNYINHSV